VSKGSDTMHVAETGGAANHIARNRTNTQLQSAVRVRVTCDDRKYLTNDAPDMCCEELSSAHARVGYMYISKYRCALRGGTRNSQS
jgi:hypothetical protein